MLTVATKGTVLDRLAASTFLKGRTTDFITS
jgi:hypothetical protein